MAPRPSTAQQSTQLTESDLKHHSQELGKLGILFGSKENAPVYLAGILAILSLIGCIFVGVYASDTPTKGDLIKPLAAIVIAALSFIGGASGRHSS